MAVLDYDKIARDYDRRYEIHPYPGIRSAILAAIDRTEHPHVLEVGCGTGKWLAEFASAGCDVAGVDPSREMLRRAPAKVRGDLRQGSAEALPWGDALFGVGFYINSFITSPCPRLRYARHSGCFDLAGSVCRSGRTLKLGHSSIRITLDLHGHLFEGDHRRYVEGLDSILDATCRNPGATAESVTAGTPTISNR